MLRRSSIRLQRRIRAHGPGRRVLGYYPAVVIRPMVRPAFSISRIWRSWPVLQGAEAYKSPGAAWGVISRYVPAGINTVPPGAVALMAAWIAGASSVEASPAAPRLSH